MTYTLNDFLKRPIHTDNPYELSHSILKDLPECERKFERNKMLKGTGRVDEDKAYHVRGNAYGAGVQAYLVTGDMDFALTVCWLSYYPEIEDVMRIPTISQGRAVNNLWLSRVVLDKIRARYKVAVFNGRPAIEMSFKLILDGKWFYIGHPDIVLYDTELHIYVVLDVKTTLFRMEDLEPLYRYSVQCLSYSTVIDTIVGEEQNSYGVLYLVCRDINNSDFIPDLKVFHFNKTLVDRLKWFYTLKMDIERLNQMEEFGLFPLRETGCVKWGRVCSHYGFCHMSSGDVKKPEQEDTRVYDFTFNLDDIIQNHIDRIGRIEQHG